MGKKLGYSQYTISRALDIWRKIGRELSIVEVAALLWVSGILEGEMFSKRYVAETAGVSISTFEKKVIWFKRSIGIVLARKKQNKKEFETSPVNKSKICM